MKNLHRFSGILISLFIFAHLFNHIISVLGVNKHIEMMNSLRKIYRNPIIEFLLVASIIFQIISGMRLIINTNSINKPISRNLQKWSGLYLAFFFTVHLSAIFVGRLILHVDTNYYYGVAGINTFPLNLFFIPYYSFAIISFFTHLATIHYNKMRIQLLGITPKYQSFIIIILGLVINILIFYGATNGFKGVSIPKEYSLQK